MTKAQAEVIKSDESSDKKVGKGIWWMPWLLRATKDVISCDKPW